MTRSQRRTETLHLRPGHGLQAELRDGTIHLRGDHGAHAVHVRTLADMERASIHACGFAEVNDATEDQVLTFRVIVEGLAAQELEAVGLAVRPVESELRALLQELEAMDDGDASALETVHASLMELPDRLPFRASPTARRLLEDASWAEDVTTTLRKAGTAHRLLTDLLDRIEPQEPQPPKLSLDWCSCYGAGHCEFCLDLHKAR